MNRKESASKGSKMVLRSFNDSLSSHKRVLQQEYRPAFKHIDKLKLSVSPQRRLFAVEDSTLNERQKDSTVLSTSEDGPIKAGTEVPFEEFAVERKESLPEAA